MSESASAAGDPILVHSARQLLTLRGPAGPRGGREMQDLGIIPDGAVLIQGGRIEDIGPTRRVANLVRAKRAREIDASGRVVMPAFVDPDAPLAAHLFSSSRRSKTVGADPPTAMSRRRMELKCAAMAQALASYGVLAAGASTTPGDDPANILRLLRVHRELKNSPVRIRPVLSWPERITEPKNGESNIDSTAGRQGWLRTIRARDFASIAEFETDGAGVQDLLNTMRFAAQAGFAIRLRSRGALDSKSVELAVASGAIAVHAHAGSAYELLRGFADVNCVFVVPSADLLGEEPRPAHEIRAALESGLAVAISSAFRPGVPASFNAQFNLHLACARLKLSPEQAITAASHNAAAALRFSDSAGSLAPGRPADLVIMDVPDYRDLVLRAGHHDSLIVMRAGRVIYRRPPLTVD